MTNLLQNNKAPISSGRVELFCLFFACRYTSMEATVLSCRFSFSCMTKVLWNNKSPISLERVEWFCWFFACNYLHLVWYSLKLQRYAVSGWHYQGYRLSGDQIVRCFKLKKLENYKRYEDDFLLPLKLQKISCYFGLWPQNTLVVN